EEPAEGEAGPGGLARLTGLSARAGPPTERERPGALTDVDAEAAAPRPTGMAELDRVLGGGLVPGSVTLLGGEPGIGKSTLVLQVLAAMADGGATGLLVSGEEAAPPG